MIGNLCAALAPEYWTLLLMRFVSGLPHGAFFGVGSIVAERVADKGKPRSCSPDDCRYDHCQFVWSALGYIVEQSVLLAVPLPVQWMLGNAGILPRLEMDTCLPALPDVGWKGQFRFCAS